ncbi:MAG: hypothetical protein V2J24_06525 [Pseudomonadales bacterium]|nr:hypothetical protein [Pseudomonadales bacterium]
MRHGLIARVLLAALLASSPARAEEAPRSLAQSMVDGVDAVFDIQGIGTWIDARLGSQRYESEVNDSFVRLTPGFRYDTADGFQERLRARVKIDLPNTENRLSLLLLGEDEGDRPASSVDLETDELLIRDTDADTSVGIQYVPLRELSHVSLTASVDSDLDPSASLRWRRLFELGEDSSLQLTLRPGWRRGDDFVGVASAEIDRRIGPGVLRTAAQLQTEDGGHAAGARIGYYLPYAESVLLGAFTEGQGAFDGPVFRDSARFGLLYRKRLEDRNFYLTILPFVDWVPEGFDPDIRYGFELEVDIYLGGGRRRAVQSVAKPRSDQS